MILKGQFDQFRILAQKPMNCGLKTTVFGAVLRHNVFFIPGIRI